MVSIKLCLVLLTVLLSRGNGAPTCDNGWEPYKDELCIKSFPQVEDYQTAKNYCALQGGATLVMVKGAELQQFLANYTSGIYDYVWLGATYDNASSRFLWEDGSPLTYTNWQDGYPRPITDPDVCIELRPSESRSSIGTKLQGRWAHITCKKRNLVMCQKGLTWSLQDAVDELLKVRKQLEKVSSRVVPVGSIYVEYHSQPSPATLWPDLSWEDVTNVYGGVFFRAHGSGSESWGVTQAECAPRVTDMGYMGNPTSYQLPSSIRLPANGWSPWCLIGFYTDQKSNRNEAIRFHTAGCEVRPKNQSIRLWKRTA